VLCLLRTLGHDYRTEVIQLRASVIRPRRKDNDSIKTWLTVPKSFTSVTSKISIERWKLLAEYSSNSSYNAIGKGFNLRVQLRLNLYSSLIYWQHWANEASRKLSLTIDQKLHGGDSD
jgi:hypothetical protein